LENLLLLARLDPEHAENLPKTCINLHTVIDEVIQALELFANQKSIQLHLQLMGNENTQFLPINSYSLPAFEILLIMQFVINPKMGMFTLL
jgi:signal transduction histidine kinase